MSLNTVPKHRDEAPIFLNLVFGRGGGKFFYQEFSASAEVTPPNRGSICSRLAGLPVISVFWLREMTTQSGGSFNSMKSGDREYLTEVLLGQFLRERVDATFVANQPVLGVGRRFRPDYHSDCHKLIVEFDGDQHYRSSRVILGDVERDDFFSGNGFRLGCF